MIDTDPFGAPLHAAKRRVRELNLRRAELQSEIEWAESFDKVAVIERCGACHLELQQLQSDLQVLASRLKELRSKTKSLAKKTELGWDPTYWFSSERSAAKERHARHKSAINKAARKQTKVNKQIAALREQTADAESELTRFDSLSLRSHRSAIEEIDAELPVAELERDDLKRRKRALDDQLRQPLDAWRSLRADLDSINREQEWLEDRRQDAEKLDRQLSEAATARDRALLHEECERIFSDGSPGRVAGEARRELNQLKKKEAGVRRDIQKLERRIEMICRRGARIIRTVVVDGNNLCYAGRTFIGLAALKGLRDSLADAYDVVVVFDASIHRLLDVNNRDLEGILHGATVHVVPAQTAADETILHAARESTTLVISNDRFGEYPDEPAVAERRIARHDIVHGKVMVHDLALDIPLPGRK